jgi:hypothetical protein
MHQLKRDKSRNSTFTKATAPDEREAEKNAKRAESSVPMHGSTEYLISKCLSVRFVVN